MLGEIGGDWTAVGTPTFSAVQFNNGTVDNDSNYVHNTLAITFPITLDFWIKHQIDFPLGTDVFIFNYLLPGYADAFMCEIWTSGVISLYLPTFVGTWQATFDIPHWSAGDKSHWAIALTTSAPYIKFYVDANPIAILNNYCVGAMTGSINLKIATGSGVGGPSINSIIDDFVIWDGEITSTELALRIYEGRVGPPPAPVAYPDKLLLGAYAPDGTTRVAKKVAWRCLGKKTRSS